MQFQTLLPIICFSHRIEGGFRAHLALQDKFEKSDPVVGQFFKIHSIYRQLRKTEIRFSAMTNYNLLAKLLFSILILLSLPTEAKKILECMQPVHLDDPNFQQGSELFFDIYWDNEKGVKIVLTKGTLETEVFLKEGSEERKNLDLADRSLYIEWKNPAPITLVLRQFDTRWYGGFWFSEGLKTDLVTILPGRDLDLSCIEKGPLISQPYPILK